MTMALVSGQLAKANSGGASTESLTVTLPSTPTMGNLLIVVFAGDTVSSGRFTDAGFHIKDSSGHDFIKIANTDVATSDPNRIAIWYLYVASAPTNGNINITTATSLGFNMSAAAWEFSNPVTSSWEDSAGRVSSSGTSNSATAGAQTPTAGERLYIHGMVRQSAGSRTFAPTWTTNAQEYETNGYPPFEASYKISSSGSEQETVTISAGTNYTWACVAATFKGLVSSETITPDKWHPQIEQPYVPKFEVVSY